MKTWPHCSSEVEDTFELCWNYNYSFAEKQIIDIKELIPGSREINHFIQYNRIFPQHPPY